jgi:hypothetical protein
MTITKPRTPSSELKSPVSMVVGNSQHMPIDDEIPIGTALAALDAPSDTARHRFRTPSHPSGVNLRAVHTINLAAVSFADDKGPMFPVRLAAESKARVWCSVNCALLFSLLSRCVEVQVDRRVSSSFTSSATELRNRVSLRVLALSSLPTPSQQIFRRIQLGKSVLRSASPRRLLDL